MAARVGASLPASLMLPFRGANFLSRSLPTVRPSWRLIPGKALCHRSEAPTFCPRACRPSVRVGASLPAKPYATVPRRQLYAPKSAGRPSELAPHFRQSLELPFRGANILPQSPPTVRPSWRLTPGKAWSYRFEAPTFLPQSLTRNPSRWLADWEAKKDRCTNKVHYAMMLIQPERRLV